MRFQSQEELRRIAFDLRESDFERADVRWDPQGAVFELETARPPSEALKMGGLFRRPREDWIRCRLILRQVTGLSLWEEYDVKPPVSDLLEVEPKGEGFRIRLNSAHGLRVELLVKRLDGSLEDI